MDQFLSERGLKVKEAKTHLVNSKEDFDFLGWGFEVKNNYFLTCVPSNKNRRQMINKIKITMRNPSKKMDKRVNKVNVIYQRLISGPLINWFTNLLRKLIVN